MLKSGTYRIYSINHTQGDPEDVLVGRFMVSNGVLTILEDHDGMLSRELPNGPIQNIHKKFFFSVDHSPYFKLIPEQHINQGLHSDLIEDVSWDDTNPEARYLLVEPGAEPQRVEMYGETAVLDGEKLDEDEIKKLVERVRQGEARLVPI